MSIKSGHRLVPVVGKEQDKQCEDFTAHGVGTLRLQPGGLFVTVPFIEYADKLYDFQYKKSDTVIMSYPKTGSTWMQELVWTLAHNLDLKNPLTNTSIHERSIFLEMDFFLNNSNLPALEPGNAWVDPIMEMFPGINPKEGLFLQAIERTPGSRTIKTHLPFSYHQPDFLDTCKVVYVVRDPKDVVVSYYHYMKARKFHGYVGNLENCVDHFINDTLIFSPFWLGVEEAWKRRDHPNLHFVYYEEMKADPKTGIKKLSSFMGLDLNDDQVGKIVEYTSFAAMKEREKFDKQDSRQNDYFDTKAGSFFRKGVSGSGTSELTEELANKIDEWTKKNIRERGLGPDFKYTK